MEPLNTIAGRAVDQKEPSKVFKNPEFRQDVIDKLAKKESDILEKIQNLYVSQNMLDRKFSCGYYKFRNLQFGIEWRLEELKSLKQSLYELYEKPIKQVSFINHS